MHDAVPFRLLTARERISVILFFLQDFSKLREAHLARLEQQQQHQRATFSTRSGISVLRGRSTAAAAGAPLSFISMSSPSSGLLGSTYTAAGGGIILPTGIQTRSFLAGAISDRLQDFRLKQLERNANHNPTNPSAQYDFLSELAQRYPEAVVERFEQFPDTAVDERCALLYFGALQRINGQGRFNLPAFVKRVQMGGGTVHPLKMQALSDLVASKSAEGKKMTKSEQATAAMQIIAGAGVAATGSMATGSAAAASLGATAGLGAGSGRGTDPRYPLHVQMHNPNSGRLAFFTLARHVLVAFVVVSAVTAVLGESK